MNAARPRAILAIAAAGLLILVLAGCGNDPTDAEPVETTNVDLPQSYKFEPAVIQVTAGSTVTWTNSDNFTHTVQVEDMGDHKIERGESIQITFDTPGEYDYVCTLHSKDMRGKVIVVAP